MTNSCITFLEKTALKYPQKNAVVDQDKAISYQELRRGAMQVAEQINVGINQPIAIMMPKSRLSIISFMATLYSRNFYVPIDIKNPKNRLDKIIGDLSPALIIVDNKSEKMVRESYQAYSIINIDEILLMNKEPTVDFSTLINTAIDTDPIYCIYTSGSTGTPKGVLVPHRGIIDYVDYAVSAFNINENVVFGNQAQFHFDISALDIYGAIKTGGTINIIPESLFVFPAKLIDYIDENKINFLYWVPSALNFVASTNSLRGQKTSLTHILFAGEVMPIKTLKYWQEFFSTTMFANLYGPTEITITCTHYIVDRVFDDSESLPIGKANFNTDVIVLSDDNKLITQEMPNVRGELCVRGSSLALGYWRDPVKTQEKFVQNPLNLNYPERIYRTGDIVEYNARGEIIFIGRKIIK